LRARHSRPALGVVFSAVVLVIAAGCSTPDPTPDPFAVLTSAGPGGRYSLEAIVDPQPESDGRFAVAAKLLGQDADLGLQSSVDLLTVDAGHLVAWADGKTVIWDGRITMNLETGGCQTRRSFRR